MIKKYSLLFCALLVLLTCGTAGATAILDPLTGGNYAFTWDGLDQIDKIYLESGGNPTGPDLGNDWSITLTQVSTLDFITAWDYFAPGDEFALVVDGVTVAWTDSYYSGNYFHGVYDDLLLTAGVHNITLVVTSGQSNGGAYASFGAVTSSPVPEPATLLLIGTGLSGLLAYRKKRG